MPIHEADASQILTSNRLRLYITVLAAVAAGLLTLGIQTSSAEAACSSGQFCTWSGESYTGTFYPWVCLSAGDPYSHAIYDLYSAKNRCGVSLEIGWNESGNINWKACMNPGGERPSPGRFNAYRWHWGAC